MNYTLEILHNDKWVKLLEGGREYCTGWFDARRESSGPKPAYRVRNLTTGKVSKESAACHDIDVGWSAGSPSPAQYARAAANALAKIRSARNGNQRPSEGQLAAANRAIAECEFIIDIERGAAKE